MIESHGYNRFYQLPVLPPDYNSAFICHNLCSTLVLTENRELSIWGYVTGTNTTPPLRVLPGVNIKSCALGLDHAVAVSDKGGIYTWGSNKHHQLGRECTSNESPVASNTAPLSIDHFLVQSPILEGHFIVSVTAGDYHTILLSEDGCVFGFGKGIGPEVQQLLPNKEILVGAKKIACGAQHTAAVLLDGLVATWGWGGYGQLGHGKTEDESHPKIVAVLADLLGDEDVCVNDIACGSWHTASVMSWGWGGYGQLGLGNDKGSTEPTMVDTIDEDILHVACGSRHTILASEQSWYAFGLNQHGQLGTDGGEGEAIAEEEKGRGQKKEGREGQSERQKRDAPNALGPLRRQREKRIKKVFAGGWTTSILFDHENV